MELNKLFDTDITGYYSSVAGATNGKFHQYTEVSELLFEKILNIFDHFSLEYYLFAGSLVGYVRNKEMPAWMDDLDIIIFEDQISLFEEKIIPYLNSAGFHTSNPYHYPKGGKHILSMQINWERSSSVNFSKEISVPIPWVQVDVFYTTISSSNCIKNFDNWGLYGSKDIPVDWVKPGKFINLLNRKIRVFHEYEKDIQKEYGDVINNIIVSSHGINFLELNNTSFEAFNAKFKKYISDLSRYTPSINEAMVMNHRFESNIILNIPSNLSFDEIVLRIIETHAEKIIISDFLIFFWMPDIKRIFPNLIIEAKITTESDCNIVTHLSSFCDLIQGINAEIQEKINSQISYFNLKKLS